MLFFENDHMHTGIGYPKTVEGPSLVTFRSQVDRVLRNLLWAQGWARQSRGMLCNIRCSVIFFFPNNRNMWSFKCWKGKTFFFMLPI